MIAGILCFIILPILLIFLVFQLIDTEQKQKFSDGEVLHKYDNGWKFSHWEIP